MRALVIYSHPVEGSFCSAMRDAAVRGLKASGHDVTVIDLTLENFNPVMGKEEWNEYQTGNGVVPVDCVRYADALKNSEIVVFVYPTWWSGLPAQLKGWLERVLVPGLGFVMNENQKVRPALKHIRRIVVLSTYGSPKLYVKLMNDNGRRIVIRTLRIATSWRTKKTHCGLYAMDKSTDNSRRSFLVSIEKKLSKI